MDDLIALIFILYAVFCSIFFPAFVANHFNEKGRCEAIYHTLCENAMVPVYPP